MFGWASAIFGKTSGEAPKAVSARPAEAPEPTVYRPKRSLLPEVALSRACRLWATGVVTGSELKGRMGPKWGLIPAAARSYLEDGVSGRDKDAYARIERIGEISDDRLRREECLALIADLDRMKAPTADPAPVAETDTEGGGLLRPRSRRHSGQVKEAMKRVGVEEDA